MFAGQDVVVKAVPGWSVVIVQKPTKLKIFAYLNVLFRIHCLRIEIHLSRYAWTGVSFITHKEADSDKLRLIVCPACFVLDCQQSSLCNECAAVVSVVDSTSVASFGCRELPVYLSGISEISFSLNTS